MQSGGLGGFAIAGERCGLADGAGDVSSAQRVDPAVEAEHGERTLFVSHAIGELAEELIRPIGYILMPLRQGFCLLRAGGEEAQAQGG